MKNKKLILGAVMTIAACGAMVAGTTYALFTSEANTNIAVSAGKVELVSTIEDLETYSGKWNETNEEYDIVATETAGTFTNGGTAKVVDGEIVIDKISPMDKVTFKVISKNNSNINIQYRTKLMCKEGANLFTGLEMTLNDDIYEGVTTISDWVSLVPGSTDNEMIFTIQMPKEAENDYQGQRAVISVTSEAVQGNAYVENPDPNIIGIYTAADLLKLAKDVNSNTNLYRNENVKVMNDIDMSGIDFPSIGATASSYPSASFQGIFDGDGNTISNLTVKANQDPLQAAGLFGALCGKVSNVIVDNANIASSHYAAGIAAFSSANVGMEVKNCIVKNSNISSSPAKVENGNYDNGDKAGGIMGYCVSGDLIEGCEVDNCIITAYRDLGGIVGAAAGTIKNNKVKNTKVIQDPENGYKEEAITTYGEIIGRVITGLINDGNTADNVTAETKD